MRWGKDKHELPSSLVIGVPAVGTEHAVGEIDTHDDGGWSALATVDSGFNATTFMAWAQAAYDRSCALWASRDAEPLRPVMEPGVFDRYAQEVLSASSLPGPRSLAAAAKASARLAGANSGGEYHNAVAVFDVAVADVTLCTDWGLPADQARWVDRWLFQRPSARTTPASGAVVVCPQCGAPATAGGLRCRYCNTDLTAETGGWVVTRVVTTMPWLAAAEDRLAKLRERMASKMAEKLPPLPRQPSGPVLQPPRAAPPP